jgi:hypothetical protein
VYASGNHLVDAGTVLEPVKEGMTERTAFSMPGVNRIVKAINDVSIAGKYQTFNSRSKERKGLAMDHNQVISAGSKNVCKPPERAVDGVGDLG